MATGLGFQVLPSSAPKICSKQMMFSRDVGMTKLLKNGRPLNVSFY